MGCPKAPWLQKFISSRHWTGERVLTSFVQLVLYAELNCYCTHCVNLLDNFVIVFVRFGLNGLVSGHMLLRLCRVPHNLES